MKPVQIGFAPFPEVWMQQHFIYIFMIDHDLDFGHGYTENFKDTFCHQKWHDNVKKKKRKMWKYWQKDEGIYYHYDGKGHLSCTYCTLEHLTNNEKNIETHFAYEDGDSDYGHMDASHLDILILFAKANESIDHLINYESVEKKNLILIFTFIWKTSVLH